MRGYSSTYEMRVKNHAMNMDENVSLRIYFETLVRETYS